MLGGAVLALTIIPEASLLSDAAHSCPMRVHGSARCAPTTGYNMTSCGSTHCGRTAQHVENPIKRRLFR